MAANAVGKEFPERNAELAAGLLEAGEGVANARPGAVPVFSWKAANRRSPGIERMAEGGDGHDARFVAEADAFRLARATMSATE